MTDFIEIGCGKEQALTAQLHEENSFVACVFDNRQAKKYTTESKDGVINRCELTVLICSSAPSSGTQR